MRDITDTDWCLSLRDTKELHHQWADILKEVISQKNRQCKHWASSNITVRLKEAGKVVTE